MRMLGQTAHALPVRSSCEVDTIPLTLLLIASLKRYLLLLILVLDLVVLVPAPGDAERCRCTAFVDGNPG